MENNNNFDKGKKKILILDDDKQLGDMLSEILLDITVIGDVHAVSDIGHARYLLKSESYDVIISDIMLNSIGGESGVDFIKEVLADYGPKYEGKVIAISADKSKIQEALENGATVGITKPFDIERLKNTVTNILN